MSAHDYSEHQPSMFAKPPGEVARDAGIALVVENAGEYFAAHVWAVIRAMPIGTIFTGETLRHRCEDAGIVAHVPQAWGGVMAKMPMSPMVMKTGRKVKPKDVKSHACEKSEYIRVDPSAPAPLSELDKLRALLSEAAAGFENLGVHAPGCGYYQWSPDDPTDPVDPSKSCDCGLTRLQRACEDASQKDDE